MLKAANSSTSASQTRRRILVIDCLDPVFFGDRMLEQAVDFAVRGKTRRQSRRISGSGSRRKKVKPTESIRISYMLKRGERRFGMDASTVEICGRLSEVEGFRALET